MSRVLITGAAGFVGHHLVKEFTSHGDQVVALDALTYAANLEGLSETAFIWHDIRSPLSDSVLKQIGAVDYIIHNAAESHVSRSFSESHLFVATNVLGTLNVLEAARRLKPKKFIYTSTDEVFGPEVRTTKKTHDQLCPTSVYSATKAGAEYLVRSYWRPFGLPTVITRTSNMFGEYQHSEKFVPHVVEQVLSGYPVEIHTARNGEMGFRNWLYVGDQAKILYKLCDLGVPGEMYHVTSDAHLTNLEMATKISEILDLELLCRVKVSNRKHYDVGYLIEPSPGLSARHSKDEFIAQLSKTVNWFKEKLRD